MRGFEDAVSLLPPIIRKEALCNSVEVRRETAEFRLRRGYPPTMVLNREERQLHPQPVTLEDLRWVLERASRASPYAVRENLAQGYISAIGGVRVGVCGQYNRNEKGEAVLGEISSISVRIPRQIKGCALELMDEPFVSTLIVSPPGQGKTTLLRDMVRLLSDGGIRVGLCDERGEVAGFSQWDSGMDVGRCTDVITGVEKARGAMMLLRSMNPHVLAMDEITAPEDVSACSASSNCGVQLLVTAHGKDMEDLTHRNLYRTLLEQKLFHRLIIIQRQDSQRVYRREWLY